MLFNIPYTHKSEEPAVLDFESKFLNARDLRAEDIIRDLYAAHCGRYTYGANPIELLRILLANGLHLKIKNRSRLSKNYYPLRFEFRSADKKVSLGEFYRTSILTPDDLFPSFCRWVDDLCGFKGMSKHSIQKFISSNFSLVAVEPEEETILMRAEGGDIVSAREETLIYLTVD